jgi:uncharacterized protein (TIGR00369 family)
VSLDHDLDRDAPFVNETATPHHCFGCGALNESGLRLRFRQARDGSVWAEHAPDRRFEGYLGVVHGGVLTAMLDEAMSWAIAASGDFAVTARLNTTFRAPAQVGRLLRVEASVERVRRRLIDTSATIIDVQSGSVIAEAEAVFMRVSESQAKAWRRSYAPTTKGGAAAD